MTAKKKAQFTLKGRGTVETAAIIVSIAAAVIVVGIFLEWLFSGKGILTQRKAAEEVQVE